MSPKELATIQRMLKTVADKRALEAQMAAIAARRKVDPIVRAYNADLEHEARLAERIRARTVRASMIARTTRIDEHGATFDAYSVVDLRDAYETLAIRRASA